MITVNISLSFDSIKILCNKAAPFDCPYNVKLGLIFSNVFNLYIKFVINSTSLT